VLAAFGIGVIVTLASAVAPAVKFARLSPMEAMRR
jgi:ABC-type antimicrobial peptide transport system permease subunit